MKLETTLDHTRVSVPRLWAIRQPQGYVGYVGSVGYVGYGPWPHGDERNYGMIRFEQDTNCTKS